jgi:hypothetical protein
VQVQVLLLVHSKGIKILQLFSHCQVSQLQEQQQKKVPENSILKLQNHHAYR